VPRRSWRAHAHLECSVRAVLLRGDQRHGRCTNREQGVGIQTHALPTLYEQKVEEYLRQLRQEAGEAKRTTAENPDTTPRAQLLALFDIAEGGNARMRGCPFHNAAVEAAGVMPAVERIVHLHKRDYADGLINLA